MSNHIDPRSFEHFLDVVPTREYQTDFDPAPIRDLDDQPETAVCPQCGDTAYLDDDGSYVCPECGNDFEDEED